MMDGRTEDEDEIDVFAKKKAVDAARGERDAEIGRAAIGFLAGLAPDGLDSKTLRNARS